MTTAISSPPGELFDHPALFYRDADEYLAGTLPFIEGALAAQAPVLVAVPGPRLGLIRQALGPAARRITGRDMTVAGRNPGRIIPSVLLAFATTHAGRRVHIIGEPIWDGRDAVEYPACAQHEALINTAFAHRDAAILCPYDVGRLHPQVLADAERTHPTVIADGQRRTSADYGHPTAVAADFNRPLPPPPADALVLQIALPALAEIRRVTTKRALAVGLSRDRADDLTLAVNELAGNTIAHGGGSGTLAIWTEPEHIICQVTDRGHIADPMAGRIPPPRESSSGGRGLILANHLCDLLRVHTEPGATTVRVQMRR